MGIVVATALLLANVQGTADKFAPGGFIDTMTLDGAGKILGCSEEVVGSLSHPAMVECAPISRQEPMDHWVGPGLRGLSSLQLRMMFMPVPAGGTVPPASAEGGTIRMTLARILLTFDRAGRQSACAVEVQAPEFNAQALCDRGRESAQAIEANPKAPVARQARMTFDLVGK
jgi:hypothetical protein